MNHRSPKQTSNRDRTATPKAPTNRRLKVFALDPLVSSIPGAAFINETTLSIPWEDQIPFVEWEQEFKKQYTPFPWPDGRIRSGDEGLYSECRGLLPGPIGEYLEVIDVDPSTGSLFEPVDLNAPALLAQDGHAPSESNPQFHQQMVYAVGMKTICNFEAALGRRVMWRSYDDKAKSGQRDRWTPRLRIYPHALRQANAYYSPQKRAILFGYFTTKASSGQGKLPEVGRNLPGGKVFTCCSHDVIAHEMTHAILDGMHRRFIESTNPDVYAFHEAFADIVALFQHFTVPELVEHQIATTRGDLSTHNMLGQLALQLGEALGQRDSLRNYIAHYDSIQQKHVATPPDPEAYHTKFEPHARGAILVSAVFEAFVGAFERRTRDLYRLATGGTGVLPQGEIHPDLVRRLTREAVKTASHFLRIAIRAIDFCPPFDITFGEYLRAIITADADASTRDDYGYRPLLIEAFRRRGIYPRGILSLSVDSCLWQPPPGGLNLYEIANRVAKSYHSDGANAADELKERLNRSWDIRQERYVTWLRDLEIRNILDCFIKQITQMAAKGSFENCEDTISKLEAATGLLLRNVKDHNLRSIRCDDTGLALAESHAARPAWRTREDGSIKLYLVLELTQKRNAYFDETTQAKVDAGEIEPNAADFFEFRGGCTLIIDVGTGDVDFSVRKGIDSRDRLERQRRFLLAPPTLGNSATYLKGVRQSESETGIRSARLDAIREPFAMLHSDD